MADWVFAYGSNMDLTDFARWCRERRRPAGRIERALPARIEGYRLVWNYHSRARGGGAANVEPLEGAGLYGVALAVCPTALAAIDAKEGHPGRYVRERVGATLLDSADRVRAWLYVVAPEHCRPTRVAPTPDYLRVVIGAARRHGLPEAWIRELEDTPTASGK